MQRLIFFLLCCVQLPLGAQNLVINPSLEDESSLHVPSHKWNTVYRPGTPLAPHWITATSSSADYYNSRRSTIGGYRLVLAKSGEGRIGFIAGCADIASRKLYKEYPMGRLKEPLQRDKYYKISFYVALDPTCKYAVDSIGAHLSSRPVAYSGMNVLPLRAQIMQNENDIITAEDGWVEVSGIYLASGGEEFITIGSFSRKTRIRLDQIGEVRPKRALRSRLRNYAYYYVDDVSVEEYDTTKGFDLNKEEVIVKAKADRFLFLVDVSESMAADGKLDSLKSALKSAYKKLPSNSYLSVVTFSSSPTLWLPFSKVDLQSGIEQAIDSLHASGSTQATRSIDFAYDYLSPFADKDKISVLFFTDGIFELAPSNAARIKSMYKDKNVSFSSFQFGNRTNNDLSKLASITQGVYVENADQNLSQKLSEQLYTVEKKQKTNQALKRGKANPGRVVLSFLTFSAAIAYIILKLA